jgi:hypothetical protein
MGSPLGVMPGLFGSTDDKAEQVDFLQEFFAPAIKMPLAKIRHLSRSSHRHPTNHAGWRYICVSARDTARLVTDRDYFYE